MVSSGHSTNSFEGLKILLVEDNFNVAKILQLMLEELGCKVVGPAPDVAEGVRLIEREALDAAVLDINLKDGNSEPIADALLLRRCPFIFVTGYANSQFDKESLNAIPRIQKPVNSQTLRNAMYECLLDRH